MLLILASVGGAASVAVAARYSWTRFESDVWQVQSYGKQVPFDREQWNSGRQKHLDLMPMIDDLGRRLLSRRPAPTRAELEQLLGHPSEVYPGQRGTVILRYFLNDGCPEDIDGVALAIVIDSGGQVAQHALARR